MAKELIPVNIFDTSGLELWFSQMAEEGLILETVKGNKAVFRDEYCQKIKYRVIPTAEKEEQPSAEMQALFEEAGWHFVCGMQESLFVFSNEEEYPKELPITKEDQCFAFEELKKRKRKSIILSILGLIILGTMQSLAIYNNIEDYILGTGQYVGFAYAMAFLLYIVALLREYRAYRLIKGKLDAMDLGYEMDSPVLPTTKWIRFENWMHLLSFLLVFTPALALYLERDGAQEVTESEFSIPYVTLQELELTKSGREYNKLPIYIEKASTFLAPMQYSIEQIGRLEYQLEDRNVYDEVYLDIDYYELRFASLGEKTVKRLMKYYSTYPVELDDVDLAWSGGLAGAQKIFMLKGNQILVVSYDGDLAIEDYTKEFVTMLK